MAVNRRYAVTLPGPVGAHGPPTVVVMHLTDEAAPGGGHIWTDSGGEWRVRIEGEVATVITAPAGYDDHQPLHAVPLP
ncbi:DUF6296 family protein [Kitasatospora sp. McL0602]|uniref:DUF6296 family protein n=1 Tax=Kitasatospora sp. McL0602 TaxID=3439530 RepID=UPI003F8C18DE